MNKKITILIIFSLIFSAFIYVKAEENFKIINVSIDKLDALGNATEDYRSFGIQFNQEVEDFSIKLYESPNYDLFMELPVSGGLMSYYVSPGNWNKKLNQDKIYKYIISATSTESGENDTETGIFDTCLDNNCSNTTSGPDLTPLVLEINNPTGVFNKGMSLNYKIGVKNIGDENADEFYYQLTAYDTESDKSQIIKKLIVNSLAPGEENNYESNAKWFYDFKGDVKFILEVDNSSDYMNTEGQKITETNEENNKIEKIIQNNTNYLNCTDYDKNLNTTKTKSYAIDQSQKIEDYCDQNVLYEATCNDNGEAEYKTFSCLIGCDNDACIGNDYNSSDYTAKEVEFEYVSKEAIKIKWKTDIKVTSIASRGESESYRQGSIEKKDFTTNHYIIFDILTYDQKYYFTLSGKDINGDLIKSYVGNFKISEIQKNYNQEDGIIDLLNLNIKPLSDNSVKISWYTNINSDTWVQYGEKSDAYTNSVIDKEPIYQKNHSKTLYDLNQQTKYFYKISSRNKNTNQWGEKEGSFIIDNLKNNDQQIEDINNKAISLFNNKFDDILTELNELRNIVKEQNAKIKYLENLTKNTKKLAENIENALNDFITYGVDENTKKLGAGERAAVIYSYKSAFNKLPENEEELADAIKIANGRWPSITNDEAEKKAKEQFKKIYKRIADMNDLKDNAAVTVMAYGLRQKAENRNLESETQGIKTFKNIYGYNPTTTEDWNIMQAITYSGATRGVDSDGDLLTDDREAKLGTDPNNKDSDGDGYLDGVEVANGFNPLKK